MAASTQVRTVQRKLMAEARDFQRLGNIGDLEGMAWAKIPTYYYDFRRLCLPLTAAEVESNFGPNIPVFSLLNQPNPDRQTNIATGGGVNEAFVACAAGIIAMGEGEAFSIHGASLTAPAAQADTPAIPLGPAAVGGECYCGSVNLNGISPADPAARLATFWWGAPTWRFIEKFFQAYRLQVILNARFQVVDESLFDVGMTPVPPEFVGASDSRIPSMPFIRATNDVMAEKALGTRFAPANIITDPDDTSACVPPPLAEVTYGHPRIIGLANRLYCFNQPLLFLPGMRFEVDFYNNDDVEVFKALQNSIQANCTTADENWTETVDANGACGINCTIPGGQISLGVVFKGFALWPSASVQYLSKYLVGGSVAQSLYLSGAGGGGAAIQYLGGLLNSADLDPEIRKEAQGVLGRVPNMQKQIQG